MIVSGIPAVFCLEKPFVARLVSYEIILRHGPNGGRFPNKSLRSFSIFLFTRGIRSGLVCSLVFVVHGGIIKFFFESANNDGLKLFNNDQLVFCLFSVYFVINAHFPGTIFVLLKFTFLNIQPYIYFDVINFFPR